MSWLTLASMSIEGAKGLSDIVSNLITAGAVIVGGLWAWRRFGTERKKWPRALVELVISHRDLTEAHTALTVKIKIHNSGLGMMKIQRILVIIRRVRPLDDELRKLLEDGELIEEENLQATWPKIERRNKVWAAEKQPEIEPSEHDEFNADFIVDRCEETVFVYVYVGNALKNQGDKELGWPVTSFYDLTNASGMNKTDNLTTKEAA